MAGASLLALLDDIATILDDVAAMTKVAAKKTAGVLGDDLALNAQQVSGVHAGRELPVVWAVAVGSLKNKAILVPAALAISAFLPWLVVPLLMIGGLYLCFEGVEKLAEKFLHAKSEKTHDPTTQLAADIADFAAHEAEKIKGAIRTDFVLSAEIIVIALGTVGALFIPPLAAMLVGLVAGALALAGFTAGGALYKKLKPR
jgi:predicted DNA repair protein MutK